MITGSRQPNEWKALSVESRFSPRLVFLSRRNLHDALADKLTRRKLCKFLRDNFHWRSSTEITEYQDRADYLIKSGSTSPSVLERWVNRIAALEEKKRHYEDILRRELDGLDDEFDTLKFLSQELSIRARGLRAKKAA